VTLDDLAERYRQDPNLRDRSKAFWTHFRLAIADVRSQLGEKKVTAWTREDLVRYRAWQRQQPMAATTNFHRMQIVDRLLLWAVRKTLLLRHPDILEQEPPEGGHYFVPTPEQMVQLLNASDCSSWLGQRDRAMWEVLYGTGLRRSEMLRLNVEDYVSEEPSLWVRQGKGRKDRKQPVGPRLALCLEYYLAVVRPRLRPRPEEGALWISVQDGRRLSGNSLWQRLRNATERLGFPQCCLHSIRHAFATHLLQGGAQLSEISRLLGHSQLETTELYTRILPQELLREYRRTHPRARRPCRFSKNS
jgi:site-specific recombinase XerD